MAWYNNLGNLVGDVGDIVTGKNPANQPPPLTPTNLSSMPGGSGSPLGSTSGAGVPGGSDAQNLAAFQAAAMSNPSISGILGAIGSAGGDVLGAIESILPTNKDGSINWGKVGSDIAGFISNNAQTILSGLTAYNSYENQQKTNQIGTQAVADATAQYATQAPLRTAGMAGMLNPSANAPDLSKLGAMATAGQSLTAPQPIPLGQNRTNLTTVAGPGSGNPFATALPMAPPPATAPTLPGMPSSTAAPIPLASAAPYTPSKFGAQPIPLATNTTGGAATDPQPPGLTPQIPNVFGPTPPKLTLPYPLVSPTT